MDEITDLICQLGRRIRLEPIDLRYRDGYWYVLVAGRAVLDVAGTTPEYALRQAIQRWDARLEPFI